MPSKSTHNQIPSTMAIWSIQNTFLTIIHFSSEDLSRLIEFLLSLENTEDQFFILNHPITKNEQEKIQKALAHSSELKLVKFVKEEALKKSKIYYSEKEFFEKNSSDYLSNIYLKEEENASFIEKYSLLAVVLSGKSVGLTAKLSLLKNNNAYVMVEEPTDCRFPENSELTIQSELADAILDKKELPNHLKKIYQGKFRIPSFSRLETSFTKDLIEKLQSVFFLFNQDGEMLLWNRMVNQVTGRSDEELGKFDVIDFFPTNEKKAIRSKIQVAFLHGQSSLEANILHKNGEVKPHFFRASFIYFQNQACLYGVGVDLTEQKQNLFEISMMTNNTDEAFIFIDRSLNVVSYNKKFEKKYKEFFRKKVIKHESILNYTNPSKRNQLAEMYSKVLEGETFVTETIVTDAKGKELIYEFTHKPAKNDSEEILGVFISASDVTLKKTAAEQLKQSEKKFKTLVQEGSDLIAVLDEKGNYKFASPNHEINLGYSSEGLLHTSAFALVHPDDKADLQFKIQALSTQKRVTSLPYRIKHKESGWRWMQASATYLKDDPNIEGLLINSTDITDLVHTQKKLESSNELFHYIQKATNEAVFDWDVKTDEFIWGEGFKRIFGHQADIKRFQLEHWVGLIHPTDAKREKLRWENFLEDKSRFQWNNEFRFLDSNGNYQFVEEVAYLIRDDEGKPMRMIGSLREQSHLKLDMLKNNFLAEIGQYFKNESKTKLILNNILDHLIKMSESELGEVWMVNSKRKKIKLYTWLEGTENLKKFYSIEKDRTDFNEGEGLPGKTWQSGKSQTWQKNSGNNEFVRSKGLNQLKANSIICFPLKYNDEVIAVILLGSLNNQNQDFYYQMYFRHLENYLGSEIVRKQQQEEVSAFFENAPDILAIADSDGMFRKVNPAFTKLLGYSHEHLTSQPFVNFLHPDDLTPTNKEYKETISGLRQSDNFVNRYRTVNGDYKWISWKSSEVFGEEGVAYAFGRDVTDKVKLNNLLEDSNRLAKLGSWEVDLSDGSNYWSSITRELMEVPDDFSPTPESGIQLYKEGSSRESIREAVKLCIEEGHSFDLEVILVTYKGDEKWVRVLGKAEKKGGKVSAISGSIQDISERKAAEMELRKSNERFEKASMASNDAIWDYDAEADKLYWSNGYKTLFGHDPGRSSHNLQGWLDKIHPKDFQRTKTSWDKMRNDPNMEYWKEEYRYKKADGIYATVEDRGLIVRNKTGQAIRIVGAMSDISQRKEFEASLQELNSELKKQAKELEMSNSELEQFAYVASHDLQEPLRMVSSFLIQLEKRYGNELDDKAKQYIHYAVDGAQRMKQIILDLLDFSRVGKNEGDKTLIDLNEVVEEALLMHRKRIEEKNAKVTVEFMPRVLGYKTPYFQLFYNLINNAFKYSKENVPLQLNITVKEIKKNWQFSIHDNGIGIEKEYFDRIFIIFQRLHGKDQYGGTGMGLSIVKKIIENFNGEIWVESELGLGTTIHFTLPKIKA